MSHATPTRRSPRRLMNLVVVSAIAVGAVSWGTACSASLSPSATPDAIPDASDGGAADAAPERVDDRFDAGDAPTPAVECATTMGPACFECCKDAHSKGVGDAIAFTNACLCGPPVGVTGVCQNECAAKECNPSHDAGLSAIGSPCDECMSAAETKGGACAAAYDEACNADPDCVAYTTCLQRCQ